MNLQKTSQHFYPEDFPQKPLRWNGIFSRLVRPHRSGSKFPPFGYDDFLQTVDVGGDVWNQQTHPNGFKLITGWWLSFNQSEKIGAQVKVENISRNFLGENKKNLETTTYISD